MQLSSVWFTNYKPFLRPATVELRPLTVLIGRNSSGKSAIARLPVLLAESVSEQATAPADLDAIQRHGVDLGASFLDLVHNRTTHGALGVGLALSEGATERVSIRATIQHFADSRIQLVTKFDALLDEGRRLSLTWVGRDPLTEVDRYECDWMGEVTPRVIPFSGILPGTDLAWLSIEWPKLRSEIRKSVENIKYLGPFRSVPERHYRYPGSSPTHVGVGGADAPAALAADSLRFQKVVSRAVSEWYAKYLGGWSLEIAEGADTFSIVVRDPRDSNAEGINLVDAGTGLSQVLPIVVQRHLEARTNLGTLEIAEQPELHLHPAAHGDLADLYLQAIRSSRGTFIVETHSENFVLRIRRRIAEGFPANLVRLYWVNPESSDEKVKSIDIDQNGDVSYWPRGVFSEDMEEVLAIRKAQDTPSDKP